MSTAGSPVLCSAKACRADAVSGVIWRNPKIHRDGRRKVWTACAQHSESLSDFLDLRGFLIEVIPVEQLDPERDG
ncbi:MAG: hypothetical protein WA892_03925 [Ornithinimicrobium sp.]